MPTSDSNNQFRGGEGGRWQWQQIAASLVSKSMIRTLLKIVQNVWLTDKTHLLLKTFSHITSLQRTTFALQVHGRSWQLRKSTAWMTQMSTGCVCMYREHPQWMFITAWVPKSAVKQITSILYCHPLPLLSGPSTARVNQVVANMAFAIATAISLCQWDSTWLTLWDLTVKRYHLIECYETGELFPFPG